MAYRTFQNATEIRIETGLTALIELVGDYFSEIGEKQAEKKRRDELAELLKHQDWELCDLGVSHDDIRAAINLPIGKSSGHYLEMIRRRAGLQG